MIASECPTRENIIAAGKVIWWLSSRAPGTVLISDYVHVLCATGGDAGEAGTTAADTTYTGCRSVGGGWSWKAGV